MQTGSLPRSSLLFQELPFTDRVLELKRLEESIERIGADSESRIILISGEAGIGKTRFCEQAKKLAQIKNLRWLSSKCRRGQDLAPYSPWVQFLRQFANQASVQLFYKVSGPYLAEIVKLIPELAESTGTQTSAQPALSAEETNQRRLQFFQSLTQFFVRLSRESPLILLFDDLQWADPATIQLLKFFRTNGLDATPILILASYRDFDVNTGENPALRGFLKELENDRKYYRIHLQRFDHADVEKLLDAMSGDQEISTEFKEVIYSKTGGNPFFIEEVLRSLGESGVMFRNEKGFWDRKLAPEIQIPERVQGLIKQRIDGLDEITREVLRTASVIGETFDFQTLKKVANEIVEDKLAQTIKLTVAAGFLREAKIKQQDVQEEAIAAETKTFTFCDESIHDVLYEELDSSVLRKIHHKIGTVLEQQLQLDSRSGTEEIVTTLALHFFRAGDRDKALDYLIKSGDRAASVFAHEQAAAYYKLSIETLDEKQELQRAKLLSRLGEETSLYLGAEHGVKYLEDAAQIYETNGQRTAAVPLLARIKEIYLILMRDSAKALYFANKEVEFLEGESPSPDLAYAYLGLALTYQFAGDRQKAIRMFEEGRRLANALNDRRTQAVAAYVAVTVESITERGVLEECEKGLNYLLSTNDVRQCVYSYYLRAIGYASLKGASNKTLQVLREAADYSAKVGYSAMSILCKYPIIESYLKLGDWKSARKVAEELWQLSQKMPNYPTMLTIVHGSLGRIFLLEGDVDRAEEHSRKALEASKGLVAVGSSSQADVDLGHIYIEKGHYSNAESILLNAYEDQKKRDLTAANASRQIELLSLIFALSIARGDSSDKIQTRLQELGTIAEKIHEPWAHAYYETAKGLFSSHHQNFELAIESYRKSVGLWRKLGWPYELARSLYLLARELFSINDPESAKTELEESIGIFKQLGAKRDEELSIALQKMINQEIESLQMLRPGRGLVAIMFTDIVGYTKLSQRNEPLALVLLQEHRKLLRPIIKRHFGREVDTIGDAFLVEFASALEAARCAVDIQAALDKRASVASSDLEPQQQVLKVRIGIHLGDVERKDKKIYGDAVNIASRIEPLAEPGETCISQQVYDQIRNYSEFSFERLGLKELKNVTVPYEIYRIMPPDGLTCL